MNKERPGILSVRALNDFRRRDTLGYLGLRYYLANSAARTDEWARRVAVDLVMTRSSAGYFDAKQFKDREDNGSITHRCISIPGPNEALAEAALLAECAKYPATLGNPDRVYSYALCAPTKDCSGDPRKKEADSRQGSFAPYWKGLQKRQNDIATVCDTSNSAVVRLTDIKKFYPSIGLDIAAEAWRKHCDHAKFPVRFRELGDKLIHDYGQAQSKGKPSLLTGPMFAHLLANLVFSDLDREFSENLPAKYFRYVDDIALVGDRTDIKRSLAIIQTKIESLHLVFHPDDSHKNMEVPSASWREARDDYKDSPTSTEWRNLIGSLKQLLVKQPDIKEPLHQMFLDEGFRIPVRDYSVATREPNYLERVIELAQAWWYRRKVQQITPKQLLDQATRLRLILHREFLTLCEGAGACEGFERKRRLTKLRFYASRLVYVSTPDQLNEISNKSSELPELFFYTLVLRTVATQNLDDVLALGTNAAQAAAQPLRAADAEAVSSAVDFRNATAEEQSLAVLLLNGVKIRRPVPLTIPESDLIRFAETGTEPSMMKSPDTFFREVACLHGLTDKPRHSGMLEQAFDEDEALAMDAIEQLHQSVSLG